MWVRNKITKCCCQGHWDRADRALVGTKVHFLLAWKSGLWFEPIETDPWIMKFQLKSLNAELNPICHLPALLEAHHILHIRRIKFKLVINQLQTTVFYLCSNEQDNIWFWELHSLFRRIFWIDTHTHKRHTYVCVIWAIRNMICGTQNALQFPRSHSNPPLCPCMYILLSVCFCFGSPVDVTLTWRLAKTLSLSLFSLIGNHF